MKEPLSIAEQFLNAMKRLKVDKNKVPDVQWQEMERAFYAGSSAILILMSGPIPDSRHIDKAILQKVHKDFEFNFKHEYWFNSGGYPMFTTLGVVLNMYNSASWQIFMHLNDNKPDRRRHTRFMRKHLFEILYFAENPSDSLATSVHMKYGVEEAKDRVDHFTSVITADIMRKLQPWYKHPRWHIYHWRLTFPLFKSWYRGYIERCDRCHQRFKRQSVYTDWNGTEHWCEKCNKTQCSPTPTPSKNDNT